MIVTTVNTTWQEFVSENYSKNKRNSDFIYRGQSNFYSSHGFEQWTLTSSFNRTYSSLEFTFKTFIGQQLEEGLFSDTYHNHEFVKRTSLDKSDLITRLYFLQHYCIPTCLIDFTFNPLIALYFSLTALKNPKRGCYNTDGFPSFFPSDCKISIYKVNHRLLQDVLGLKNISTKSNDFFLNYERYEVQISPWEIGILGLDINPQDNISKDVDNYNLRVQESAFILFDNSRSENEDFVSFVQKYCDNNNIVLNEPIIKIYNIEYNSLYKPLHSRQNDYIPVFRFLEENNATGRELFNDFQALKYDFAFFHDK